MLFPRRSRKIFGIGRNKTGTTSLQKAFEDWGLKVGNQAEAELLISEYKQRNFRAIIEYCKTGEAFQDIPFSLPYTFIALDQYFFNAKFILTVRGSAEEWYRSLVEFHSKLFGKEGRIPTKEDLQNATYRYKGFVWEVNRVHYNTPEDDVYNKKILIDYYNNYNNTIIDYFKFRPKDLLVINPADTDAYQRLCDFLDQKKLYKSFPWENKT